MEENPNKIKKRQKVLFFLKCEKENEKEKEPADEVTNKTGESIDKTDDRTEEDLGGVHMVIMSYNMYLTFVAKTKRQPFATALSEKCLCLLSASQSIYTFCTK